MAEALIESKRPGWRNAKHAAQWTIDARDLRLSQARRLDVKAVDTDAVLDVLRPIWTTKTETASRVRQRIEAVLDYATAIKARAGDNPARWRGHLDHLLPKPSKVRAVKHHAALDWRRAPPSWPSWRSARRRCREALAFTILTAARSGEVRGMRWGELDLERGVDRAGHPHQGRQGASRTSATRGDRAPGRARGTRRAGFPSPAGREAASDAALAAVLERMGYPDITVHGFRPRFATGRERPPCIRAR